MRLPKNFLAPISEYTNLPFRTLCQRYGAVGVIAPLVNATALARRKDAIKQLEFCHKEKNFGVQLFGSDPSEFKTAAEALLDNFSHIKWFDINCACPMENVTKIGAGSALLRAPKKAEAIVSSLKRVGLPVSVKMRLLPAQRQTLEFCRAVEREGADFLIVHGRTPQQFYSGKADWERIRDLHESISIPLVGNGDIANSDEGKKLVRDGYCDSFMIGRAAMRNPLCFKNKELRSLKEQKKILDEYYSLCERFGCVKINDLRQKALHIIRGCSNCSRIRAGISSLRSVEDFVRFLDNVESA